MAADGPHFGARTRPTPGIADRARCGNHPVTCFDRLPPSDKFHLMRHIKKEIKKGDIAEILEQLSSEGRVTCRLPGGGRLHIERQLPFLLVYRKKRKDAGTREVVLSEASYLIVGKHDFQGYQNLLYALSDKMSAQFEGYFLLEIYAGRHQSRTFYIKGPDTVLPKTLKVLEKSLCKMNDIHWEEIHVEIQDTTDRHPPKKEALLSVETAKKCGALFVALEVPPIYRNERGAVFPNFFRLFHNCLTESIQRALFEFIRVQTASGIGSYHALGTRYPQEKIFEIDKKLAAIQRSYQFLWLVSPSNIYDIKKAFFESGFKTLLDYHYRFLPIDPDVLKRKLYKLRIEKINDPALAYLLRQKREELDSEITMLNERGTPNFFYNSLRLHHGLDSGLLNEAQTLLENIAEKQPSEIDRQITAGEFAEMAREEFTRYREQHPDFRGKIHVRQDVNIIMVSQGELYIPEDYMVSPREAQALMQHEVGTHMLTYFNGRQQPFEQFGIGLADYDTLQEGLAVLAEYLTGGLSGNRLRILAGRVVAGKARLDGRNFRGIFHLLCDTYGFTKDRSFNITSRIMQGGGFLKDIIYFKGLLQLRKYLQDGGRLQDLLLGKFGFQHIELVQRLRARNILKPAALLPSYVNEDDYNEKLDRIREGLPIPEMAFDWVN